MKSHKGSDLCKITDVFLSGDFTGDYVRSTLLQCHHFDHIFVKGDNKLKPSIELGEAYHCLDKILV